MAGIVFGDCMYGGEIKMAHKGVDLFGSSEAGRAAGGGQQDKQRWLGAFNRQLSIDIIETNHRCLER